MSPIHVSPIQQTQATQQISPPTPPPPTDAVPKARDDYDDLAFLLQEFGWIKAGDVCRMFIPRENVESRKDCTNYLSEATFGEYLADTIYNNWGRCFVKVPQSALRLLQLWTILIFIIKVCKKCDVPIIKMTILEIRRTRKMLYPPNRGILNLPNKWNP